MTNADETDGVPSSDATQEWGGNTVTSTAPHSWPWSPEYAEPSEELEAPAAEGKVKKQRSGTWVLIAGVAALAGALIGGGIVAAVDEKAPDTPSSFRRSTGTPTASLPRTTGPGGMDIQEVLESGRAGRGVDRDAGRHELPHREPVSSSPPKVRS